MENKRKEAPPQKELTHSAGSKLVLLELHHYPCAHPATLHLPVPAFSRVSWCANCFEAFILTSKLETSTTEAPSARLVGPAGWLCVCWQVLVFSPRVVPYPYTLSFLSPSPQLHPQSLTPAAITTAHTFTHSLWEVRTCGQWAWNRSADLSSCCSIASHLLLMATTRSLNSSPMKLYISETDNFLHCFCEHFHLRKYSPVGFGVCLHLQLLQHCTCSELSLYALLFPFDWRYSETFRMCLFMKSVLHVPITFIFLSLWRAQKFNMGP